MSVRSRYLLAAGTWAALVTGLLAGLPLLWRHRLPDPMASHWGPSGAPDAAASLPLISAVPVALWAVLAGAVLASMIRGKGLRRRRARCAFGAMLAGGGVYLLGLEGLTIYANLDRADWRDAAHIGPQVLLVIVAGALAGWAGWRLARPGPDEQREPASRPELPHPPRPGDRMVWVSSLRVAWATWLAVASLAAAVVLAALTVIDPPWRIHTAVTLGVVAIAGFAVSGIRVQVDDRGLAIAFGPLRWPVRRVALSRIESAWVEERRPSDVGGWGYRGLPGSATIMLRGGECLFVRYTSGGRLGISIDDAERGAALLNSLIAERAPTRDQ